MVVWLTFYLVVVHHILLSYGLQCYSCSGITECGTLFSPKTPNVKIIKAKQNETHIFSCSISVTPEGLTTRDLVPSYKCRSSPYEFCCNEDLCNKLATPPLPAFTSLKCAIGKCIRSNGICIYDAAYVTILSSATESCAVSFGKVSHKYYQKACQPTIGEGTKAITLQSPDALSVYCCNSPECNSGRIENAIKGSTLQCYTCDSRITGLDGCLIFNESSPYVYKAGSSSNQESCATIVGLEGRDATTGLTYSNFSIRTFVPNCVNQPFGRVSYGGVYFKGRVECCSTPLCNKKSENAYIRFTETILRKNEKSSTNIYYLIDLELSKDTKKRRTKKKLIFNIVVIVNIIVLILIVAIISWSIYRCVRKNPANNYDQCATSEPPISIESLKNNIQMKPFKKPSTTDYPEHNAAP